MHNIDAFNQLVNESMGTMFKIKKYRDISNQTKGTIKTLKDKTITWNNETQMTGQHEPVWKPEVKLCVRKGKHSLLRMRHPSWRQEMKCTHTTTAWLQMSLAMAVIFKTFYCLLVILYKKNSLVWSLVRYYKTFTLFATSGHQKGQVSSYVQILTSMT